MTPEQVALSSALRKTVMNLRNPAEPKQLRDAWRMPDDESLLDTFDYWSTTFGKAGMTDEEHSVFCAVHYYGPAVPLGEDRWHSVVDCVHKYGYKSFRTNDLPQLVFAYGLGIAPIPKPFPNEDQRWGQVWGDAVWGLRQKLVDLEAWGIGQLASLPPFWNNPPSTVRPGVAQHFTSVLLGESPCDCMAQFVKAHPRARQAEVELRHHRQHLFQAWLNRSGWPEGSEFKRRIYPISRFVFRALIGDRPQHAKGFEKGLLFNELRVGDSSLQMVEAATCAEKNRPVSPDGHLHHKSCGAILHSPESCPDCQSPWPKINLSPRIIVAGTLTPTPMHRCAVCKRLCPTDTPNCYGHQSQTPQMMRRPKPIGVFFLPKLSSTPPDFGQRRRNETRLDDLIGLVEDAADDGDAFEESDVDDFL